MAKNIHYMKSFDEVWELIVKHEHEDFQTKNGKPFTYIFCPAKGNTLVISLTNRLGNSSTSKTVLKKGFEIGKCSGPGEYAGRVGGGSYEWAILHDKRINSFE